MSTNLFAITPTHTELGRQFPKTSHSRFIGLQELRTQIIRIRLWHRLVFAEIADSNMNPTSYSGYSNSGSALDFWFDVFEGLDGESLNFGIFRLTGQQTMAGDDATEIFVDDHCGMAEGVEEDGVGGFGADAGERE